MILALGALAATYRRWLAGPPRNAIPFALLAAAGVSALGVGFCVWPLAATAVLVVAMAAELRAGRGTIARYAALAGTGVAVLFVAALPTWLDVSGSLHVARTIASTSNPGNLPRPLRASQLLGVWLKGSYKQSPAGLALGVTRVLIVVVLASCVAGAVYLVRRRALALAGWLALMLAAWLAVGLASTTWVTAKGEMLTSSAVVLIAWAGVAALRASSRPPLRRWVAPVVALALAGGVLASDFAQYHGANLAPTARLNELASLNRRFAGRGPALVTDFDEYALYQLRDLDVGGPNFAYPPAQLAALAGGYGQPVALERASAASLRGYPLIITRRDPAASPPPGAYRLLWRGRYYDVWGRGTTAGASVHVALSGAPDARCAQIAGVARVALRGGAGASLVAAAAPELVRVPLAQATHPAGWGHQRAGLVMSRPGSLRAAFTVPRAGVWQLWLQGQIMPSVGVSIDGHGLASVSGQLDGNSLVPDTIRVLAASLAAGRHRVALTRGGFRLAPGDGGSAVLDAIFLTPGGEPARSLRSVPASSWRTLCDGAYAWVEGLSAA